MTEASPLPGSNFPGPTGAKIYIECYVNATTIREALDDAEAALLADGYRVTHISRCSGYDLDDWDYDEYPIDSDLRRISERIIESDVVEFGPFCFSDQYH